ncbi:MAG: hypothetical protein ORN58_02290, partial [Sediminibacterium sp.]|nr:hypothetical protein [Sediminibacterium sp.]
PIFYFTNILYEPILVKLNITPNAIQNPKEIYSGYNINGVLQPISIITCIHNDIGGIISPSVYYNSVDPINGNTARITYSASLGYIVDSIFINGVYNAHASDSIDGYTFNHVNSLQTITVKFKKMVILSKPKKLQVKVFIEGLIEGNTMRPALYNSYSTGSCNTCLNDPQYADSIEIQLRDTINNLIFKTKTLLKVNGDAVVDIDTNVNIGKYYILIKHRSTIDTWSANALLFNDSIINYDFSTSRAAAFGNNLKRINNVYAIYSGHVHNTDQTIDIDDLNLIKNDFRSYAEGYVQTDLNGNGYLDTDDLVIFKFNFINYISAISPFENE